MSTPEPALDQLVQTAEWVDKTYTMESSPSYTPDFRRMYERLFQLECHISNLEKKEFKFRKYQYIGIQMMWVGYNSLHGVALFYDMGFGKTLTFLAYAYTMMMFYMDRDLLFQEEYKLKNPDEPVPEAHHFRVLIVAPVTLLRDTWLKEAKRVFKTKDIHVYHGEERDSKQNVAKMMRAKIVITTYDLIRIHYTHIPSNNCPNTGTPPLQNLFRLKWDILCVDEVHTLGNGVKFTNTGKVAKKLPKKVLAMNQLSHRCARHAIGLSGTPAQNHISDLAAIAVFLNRRKTVVNDDKRHKKSSKISMSQSPNKTDNRKLTKDDIEFIKKSYDGHETPDWSNLTLWRTLETIKDPIERAERIANVLRFFSVRKSKNDPDAPKIPAAVHENYPLDMTARQKAVTAKLAAKGVALADKYKQSTVGDGDRAKSMNGMKSIFAKMRQVCEAPSLMNEDEDAQKIEIQGIRRRTKERQARRDAANSDKAPKKKYKRPEPWEVKNEDSSDERNRSDSDDDSDSSSILSSDSDSSSSSDSDSDSSSSDSDSDSDSSSSDSDSDSSSSSDSGSDSDVGEEEVSIQTTSPTDIKASYDSPNMYSTSELTLAVDESCKLTKAVELTYNNVVITGGKQLIFVNYRKSIRLLYAALKQKMPDQFIGVVHGDVPMEERDELFDLFRNPHSMGCNILVMTVTCAGVGLNLSDANWVMFLSPSLNTSREDQAVSRAHRCGQTRTVTVQRLYCQGFTVDNHIRSIQNAKMKDVVRMVTPDVTGDEYDLDGKEAPVDFKAVVEFFRQLAIDKPDIIADDSDDDADEDTPMQDEDSGGGDDDESTSKSKGKSTESSSGDGEDEDTQKKKEKKKKKKEKNSSSDKKKNKNTGKRKTPTPSSDDEDSPKEKKKKKDIDTENLEEAIARRRDVLYGSK